MQPVHFGAAGAAVALAAIFFICASSSSMIFSDSALSK